MSKRTMGVLLAAFALLCTPAVAAQNAEALIVAAKEASGGAAWNKIGGLHQQGSVVAGGLEGRFEQWVDLKGLRAWSTYDLGPTSGTEGWDGHRQWSVDSSKDVRIETSEQSIASAVQNAYRNAYGFFFSGRYPVVFGYEGVRIADGIAYDVVKVSPKGTEPFDLWIDRKTHLIAREVQTSGDQPQAFIFSDWRTVGPILLPFQTIVRTADSPKFDRVSRATIIETSGEVPRGRFAPPSQTVTPALWPAGKSSVTVPFRLINNHIYIRASIDGKPVANMIFDTGATDILERGHAKALGVKVAGALPIGGIGSNVASFGLTKVKSVSIGGLTLADQVFGAVDLDPILKVEDADFAGLVGYEFARRAALTIDYAARTVTFTKPEDFRPPRDATPIAFAFREHTPIIAADVDGVRGQFELDTGARTGLMIMGPFAKKHGLISRYHAMDEMTVSYGVGGPSRACPARIGALAIGGITLKSPVANFATGTSGDAASAYIAGNIGGDILKRFTVILDYAHQRLWLEPNALASAPEVFDRSGLWLSRAPDGDISVGDVAHGSAAQSAGIEAGDEIVAVNGKPASRVRLYQLREALKGDPGTRFIFTVKQGGRLRAVQLLLKKQV